MEGPGVEVRVGHFVSVGFGVLDFKLEVTLGVRVGVKVAGSGVFVISAAMRCVAKVAQAGSTLPVGRASMVW